MLQILGKGAGSSHHAATIVAKDGVSVVTLEAHVEKDIDAPQFHVYHGLKGFCSANNENGIYLEANKERGTVYHPGVDSIHTVRRSKLADLERMRNDLSRITDLTELRNMMNQFMEFTQPAR